MDLAQKHQDRQNNCDGHLHHLLQVAADWEGLRQGGPQGLNHVVPIVGVLKVHKGDEVSICHEVDAKQALHP
jgi:hypothetical protein